MEYRASAATVSRKLSNGFAVKSIYDGVFAAPSKCAAAKLSSPVEDYREMFGCGGDGARGSSIPVLDVPELRESKVSVDARSSKLDYDDIFGGFRDSDYGVSLEELTAKPRKGRSSSEEARTPAYNTRSPSEGSNPSNCPLENQASSYEAPCQSFGEMKQFNILYQKTNVGIKNGTTGTMHIAQLHAVPGYTCLIDESTPSRKTQEDSPVTPVGSDTYLKMHCVDGRSERTCSQKSMSGLLPGYTNKQTAQGGVRTHSKSFSNDVLFDVNDFGLGTYPPKVQPPSSLSSNAANCERESKGSVASNFKSSTFDAADAGDSSPPYFGEEVDKNSVAAASAAAVKLAIEKAQARMRLAKELMERKKEGLQSRERESFKDGLRAQKKRGEKVAVKADMSEEEKAQEICEKVNTPMKLSDWIRKKDAMNVGQVSPGAGDLMELFSTKTAVEGMQMQEFQSAQADHMLGETKERETEEQFRELVGTIKHTAMALEVKQEDDVNENISSINGLEQDGIGMTNSTPEKPVDDGMKYKVMGEVLERDDSEKRLYASEGRHELEAHKAKLMSAQQIHDQEGEKKLEVLQDHEETEKEVGASQEQDECDEIQKDAPESMGIRENVEAKELEENESMRCEEVHERVENKKIGVDEEQEECSNGSENIDEMGTEARRLEDRCGQEENEKRLDESCGGREEEEMKPEEPCKREENEKQQRDADSGETTENSVDGIHKRDMIEEFNNFDEGGESEEYFEDSKSEENEQLEEVEESKEELDESYQVEAGKMRQEETCEWADTAEIWTEIDQREEENEETVEATQEAFKYQRNNFEATDDTGRHGEHEQLSETKETCTQKEIDKDLEATSESILPEDERIMEASTSSLEARDSEKGPESPVEIANDLDYNEIFDTHGMSDGTLELDEMIKRMKEANDAFSFNANGPDSGKVERNLGTKQNDQHAEESETVSDIEKHFNLLVHELGENNKSDKDAGLSAGNGENRYNSQPTYEERWVCSREAEAAQQPSTSDRIEDTGEIAQEFESSQSSEKIKANCYETLITEERQTKYTGQKEVDLEKEHIKKLDEGKEREKEHIKKLDEAKEREKEREKERIAVEKAIREARERAFAEARERAAIQKLTSGTQRKPVTEVQERLGKASTEANYQSSADKEAKLKAERAAVERATAEARKRALEKAMSGKAASDARNQAEKFSGVSRDAGTRSSFPSSDTQNRASGPSNSSRPSNHGVPYSIERSEGANSELAQRFKAEWERQQRTAERAAKALAEKNKRDLLAQNEQAERNRLAEALDADIKRWSNGKEGNLRALLSTLHYILGPDSGWQPVPLTDLIVAAAVKKTYRKATLFVHPDKLQQRGASIHQKYMCEKVLISSRRLGTNLTRRSGRSDCRLLFCVAFIIGT